MRIKRSVTLFSVGVAFIFETFRRVGDCAPRWFVSGLRNAQDVVAELLHEGDAIAALLDQHMPSGPVFFVGVREGVQVAVLRVDASIVVR